MALLSPCLGTKDDPCGIPSPRGGCPKHRRARASAHHNVAYDNPVYKRVRARTLAAWRAEHGEWCPGADGHEPHRVIPPDILTLDHTEGVAAGILGPRRVLCKAWNSRLGGLATPR